MCRAPTRCDRPAGRCPFADLAILDPEEGTPVPIGEEGEIAIRCDGQMLGFWQDPEATASRMIDDWVLTGDIGRLDDNGYLYVLDRKDDMIISRRLQHLAGRARERHRLPPEGDRGGGGRASRDERWGERPLAVCVVEEDGQVGEDEVIGLCVERLGSYKKPAQVVFQTEPLPKSAVGKLARKVIREPYWAGVDRRVAGA